MPASYEPALTRGCSAVQFGMEMWARFAHKSLWHDYAPGWALHKSHHEPRKGPFEVRGADGCLARRKPGSPFEDER